MTEKEQNTDLGIILLFIGGLLLMIGGILLGSIQTFYAFLAVPSDVVVILEKLIFLGIILDLLGICFYSNIFHLKDKRMDKPHVVFKGE
jgi:hypothetical protein